MSGTNQLQLLSTELLRLSYYLSLSLFFPILSLSLFLYFPSSIKKLHTSFLEEENKQMSILLFKKKRKRKFIWGIAPNSFSERKQFHRRKRKRKWSTITRMNFNDNRTKYFIGTISSISDHGFNYSQLNSS